MISAHCDYGLPFNTVRKTYLIYVHHVNTGSFWKLALTTPLSKDNVRHKYTTNKKRNCYVFNIDYNACRPCQEILRFKYAFVNLLLCYYLWNLNFFIRKDLYPRNLHYRLTLYKYSCIRYLFPSYQIRNTHSFSLCLVFIPGKT